MESKAVNEFDDGVDKSEDRLIKDAALQMVGCPNPTNVSVKYVQKI